MRDYQEDNRDTPADEAEARREFLRKSVYAVYATPVIMSLLVEKANAGCKSWGHHRNDTSGPSDPPPPPGK